MAGETTMAMTPVGGGADVASNVAASDMYQLLSVTLRLPDEDLARGVLDGRLADDAVSILSELHVPGDELDRIRTRLLALRGDAGGRSSLLTEMRQEYTRLFTHPRRPTVAIYETTFRHDPASAEGPPSLFVGPAALDAERCYRKAGLLLTTSESNEPADHMATEMEFMMFLHREKAVALHQGDRAEVARREAEIGEFTELHLREWAPAFFSACASSSESEAYRAIGELGSVFMSRVLAR